MIRIQIWKLSVGSWETNTYCLDEVQAYQHFENYILSKMQRYRIHPEDVDQYLKWLEVYDINKYFEYKEKHLPYHDPKLE